MSRLFGPRLITASSTCGHRLPSGSRESNTSIITSAASITYVQHTEWFYMYQIAFYLYNLNIDTHTHTCQVNVGELVPLDSLSPYILFNTIPPCPSLTEGTAVKEEKWRESTLYCLLCIVCFIVCCNPAFLAAKSNKAYYY